ncbi:MAG: GIY-YIG nuclease family protein [Oleiphilaceae bacterium]|nr:GIY-YIG nuclease family protein [Oleiphilaceae bacterium]
MNQWFLYLIRTARGSLYTGITTDVQRRLTEHEAGGGRGARSLRGKGPLTLAYHARVGDRVMASRLEWQVKRWPRIRKEALIAGQIELPSVQTNEIT